MKASEINIRDTYVLGHDRKYYLYGTRGPTVWGPADGFDCYVSSDLENWDGPVEIFHNHGDFWADRHYWSPECWHYKGGFYLFASFKSEKRPMGTQILRSGLPTGPFEIHSDGPVTPKDWECLDGTLYIDSNGTPYMVFSASFIKNPRGEMYVQKLTIDLKAPVGKPRLLFMAADAPWTVPFPRGKEEFHIEEPVYFSDGPFLYRTKSGRLLMLWSSFGEGGYSQGIASSDNDEIDGNWIHDDETLFTNGGHGMIFRSFSGILFLAVHYPNEFLSERPVFIELIEANDRLLLKKQRLWR
jgi:arabinan endo-1,5-alpha-L-arabinosidase